MSAKLYTLGEWHEELGDVLWWKFPISEPPYLGCPLDVGKTIIVAVEGVRDGEFRGAFDVGGWPGYHTHFTMIEQPSDPAAPADASGRGS